MRVLHVNKFGHTVGGVETHISTLRAEQALQGLTTSLFTVEDVHGSHGGFSTSASGVADRLRSIRTLLWSPEARRSLSARIREWKPDVVHFHNIYHHLSASVIHAARVSGAATVMTMHDYKVAAPCYLLYRDGHQCTECVGRRFPAPAIAHRCVKTSPAASAVCAVEQTAHTHIYRDEIDLAIVPSETAEALLRSSRAIDPARVRVVPHGVGVVEPRSQLADQKSMIFFGRLSPEKGVATIIEAWRRAELSPEWTLHIVGDGALRTSLESTSRSQATIEFHGHLEGDALASVIDQASVALVPSRFPETFGLSAAEAMAHGIATLVSDRGNLPALAVDPRQVVPYDDVRAWASAMQAFANSPDSRTAIASANRAKIQQNFTPARSARLTTAIYDEALAAGPRHTQRATSRHVGRRA